MGFREHGLVRIGFLTLWSPKNSTIDFEGINDN